MYDVPVVEGRSFISHSDLTACEVDIIGSVLPMRKLGIREAGDLPMVAFPEFELRSPRVESLVFFFLFSQNITVPPKKWHLYSPLFII